jgi:plasmid stability protein
MNRAPSSDKNRGNLVADAQGCVLSLLASMSTAGNGAMASLSVRNLDDDLLARLKRRAARHGRSAEAEVRDILRQTLSGEADTDFDTLAAELRALTSGRRHTPAEDLLREGRDER